MPISININGVDKFTSSIQIRSQRYVDALTAKMTLIMKKLQEKIILEKLPTSGILDENISSPEVTNQEAKIEGKIKWLGGTQYYAINPLTEAGTKQAIIDKEGRKLLRRGHLKGAELRTGKEVLHFIGKRDGKEVFAPYVFHPPFPYANRMQAALEEMEDDIRSGLAETIRGEQVNLRP